MVAAVLTARALPTWRLLVLAGTTYRPIDAYRGSDWLSLAMGGLFMVCGVVMTVPAGRYVRRRWGAGWAIGLTVAFWLVTGGAALIFTHGFMTWQSLLALAACAVLSVCCVGLLPLRNEKRCAGPGREEAIGSSLAPCPGCGVKVDHGLELCPLCGGALSRSRESPRDRRS